MRNHSTSDCGRLNFTQFKSKGVGHMFLFNRGLADVELTCLAVVVCKTLRTVTQLWAVFFCGVGLEAAFRRFAGTAKLAAPGVRLIVNSGLGVNQSHMTVLLERVKRALRRVDR